MNGAVEVPVHLCELAEGVEALDLFGADEDAPGALTSADS